MQLITKPREEDEFENWFVTQISKYTYVHNIIMYIRIEFR